MSKLDSDSNSLNKNWELNIYELNRIPHEIIYDDTEIAVSPKILQNELMCPICLDILKSTMTTKECLHRFCHDCIITALRAGNKECPTCRKKLVSKRSLRPDPNFDGIIAKIYPNRDEIDALHEKVLEKLNKKHLTAISNAHNSSSSSGHKSRRGANHHANNHTTNHSNEHTNDVNMEQADQAATTSTSSLTAASTSNNHHNEHHTNNNNNHQSNFSRSNRKQPAANHSDDSDMESRASTEQSSLHLPNDLDEIELVLKPHPFKELNLNSNRFLKTTSNATINHLSKYLWTRLCVEPPQSSSSSSSNHHLNTTNCSENDFQLFICTNEKLPNSYQLLNSNFTLEFILEKHWKLNRPIELFYFLKATNATTSSTTNGSNNNNNNDQLNGTCSNSNSSSMSSSNSSSSSVSY